MMPQDTGGKQQESSSSNQVPFVPSSFLEAQKFFEKIISLPPYSMMRGITGTQIDQYKGYSELIKLYTELYEDWFNLYVDFSRAFMTIIANINSKLLTSSPSNMPRDIYNNWINELSSGIDTLFREPIFASKLAKAFSKMMDVRKKSEELLEDYYSMFNLPTRSEMKKLYKEIHFLKRKLQQLEEANTLSTQTPEQVEEKRAGAKKE
jgi:hypothetical protein